MPDGEIVALQLQSPCCKNGYHFTITQETIRSKGDSSVDTTGTSEKASKRTALARRSLLLTVLGSALLWSWGFLCYLSPALFPPGASEGPSIGLEFGFFASQATSALFAVAVVSISRKRRIVVPRWAFLAAAIFAAASSLGLAWAVRASMLWAIIGCGIIDGISVPLLIVAWGTRYSLGSRNIRPLVVISFLVAYLLYLVLSRLPHPAALIVVIALPLISWLLWNIDARMRHGITVEVFPTRGVESEEDMPGELSAGSWETSVLPWRSMSVLVLAAFIGNLMASVILGFGYALVDSLFFGGIIVCACIATMTLVPLAANHNALSVSSVYRITLSFTAIGLVAIMVFGTVALTAGGALVQGSAFFLQALIILKVTQSTQELGISPLLAFSVGQGLMSAVVFSGNVIGKQIFLLFGSGDLVLNAMCGVGLLALFFMLIARASTTDDEFDVQESENVTLDESSNSKAEIASITTNEPSLEERVRTFAQINGLTKREEEVFELLAKGRSLPYIADMLFVTTGTVKTHTVHIYRKLQVNSRQEMLDLFEGQR